MRRQNVVRLIALAGALLLLGVSCYLNPESETDDGSITVEMGLITAQAGVSGETARLYLLAEQGASQGLYPLDGGEQFVEVDTEDTITIEGVAPGSGYRVLISFGSAGDGFFEVTEYAESDPFEVKSGTASDVSVDVSDGPFIYPSGDAEDLNGKDLGGVVFNNDEVFVADEDTLYRVVPDLGSRAAAPQTVPASVNTVSRGGANPVLVNTDEGIFYPDGAGGFEQSGYQDPVTLSAQFDEDVIFQGPGVIGATGNIANPVSEWAAIDVGEVVSGSPIRSYAVRGGNSAVVTAFGAFRAETGAFETLGEESTWDDIQAKVGFFDSDVPAKIISVGYNAGGTLYVGTDSGIYRGLPDGSFEGPVFDSAGSIITQVASGSGDRQAFLGPYYLYVWNAAEETLARYPFVAGLPGNPTDITFGGDRLYITGDEGLVALE